MHLKLSYSFAKQSERFPSVLLMATQMTKEGVDQGRRHKVGANIRAVLEAKRFQLVSSSLMQQRAISATLNFKFFYSCSSGYEEVACVSEAMGHFSNGDRFIH